MHIEELIQQGVLLAELDDIVDEKDNERQIHEKKQRAKKHFESLDSGMQNNYLWQAGARLRQTSNEIHTSNKMHGNAYMTAYIDAGEPEVDIDTSIDYEVVVAVRKPMQGVGQ